MSVTTPAMGVCAKLRLSSRVLSVDMCGARDRSPIPMHAIAEKGLVYGDSISLYSVGVLSGRVVFVASALLNDVND